MIVCGRMQVTINVLDRDEEREEDGEVIFSGC
jgi:hypothetical protein